MIRQAKNFVVQHYAEYLSGAGSKACVPEHIVFQHAIQDRDRCWICQYLQHIRIEQAKKLLKTSKMRIADIAEKVGYRDIKFFNKIFVKGNYGYSV